jgi:transcription elongation factor Elf1
MNTYYVICKCDKIISIKENTFGVICNNCGTYIKVEEKLTFDQLNIFPNSNIIVMDSERIKYHEFRSGIEKRAYQFKDKQIGKPKVLHGPIDPVTGLKTK